MLSTGCTGSFSPSNKDGGACGTRQSTFQWAPPQLGHGFGGGCTCKLFGVGLSIFFTLETFVPLRCDRCETGQSTRQCNPLQIVQGGGVRVWRVGQALVGCGPAQATQTGGFFFVALTGESTPSRGSSVEGGAGVDQKRRVAQRSSQVGRVRDGPISAEGRYVLEGREEMSAAKRRSRRVIPASARFSGVSIAASHSGRRAECVVVQMCTEVSPGEFVSLSQ